MAEIATMHRAISTTRNFPGQLLIEPRESDWLEWVRRWMWLTREILVSRVRLGLALPLGNSASSEGHMPRPLPSLYLCPETARAAILRRTGALT